MRKKQQKRPLTVSEVARLFGKDGSTILRWTRDGRLKPLVKLPGKTGAYLYTAADVERAAKAAGLKVEIPADKASA